ncbi:hypothetical protein [Alienimonas californiensis]|uniref:Uncharacterized protein n=1 Tax=Alienimonas californiensis TaxID=2527989 RepID=A0A517PFA1_9PLAN|nr:hypothetical protein [Alienimonas californiensis]QDT18024.1 hypothetical protein CA12_41620 [Alienimonas californiensis]
MTTLAEIEAAALALPPEQFEELLSRLDQAVALATQPPAEKEENELRERVRAAEGRLDAYQRGEITAVSHEEVMREIDARIEAARRRQEEGDPVRAA